MTADNLLDIASKGGNYLLNIGPTGDGTVPPESVATMTAVGRWMDVNAEAIRGTTAATSGKPSFDGRFTQTGRTIYAHVFKLPEGGGIVLPFKATQATLLGSGKPLNLVAGDNETKLVLRSPLPDPIATVIRLELTE
ncbi:MAG: alpha-L-fucosidase [Akkermansiaceae bacterium]|nr:alpha-L-fucosidase [Akkermansiaceae bacterium]MCF7734631.1 alpha-L-fucosidase [Akkermansiaceae bacterium]